MDRSLTVSQAISCSCPGPPLAASIPVVYDGTDLGTRESDEQTASTYPRFEPGGPPFRHKMMTRLIRPDAGNQGSLSSGAPCANWGLAGSYRTQTLTTVHADLCPGAVAAIPLIGNPESDPKTIGRLG